MELNTSSVVVSVSIGSIITYVASICISRLYFHSLAKSPGPWLAAVATWYEGYYDIIHQGRYIFEVEKMH
jgi:hypothetical protein